MEQVVRKDGFLYYGNKPCSSPERVYQEFRDDYHTSIGKDANRRLNREGQRTDVLHWKGFVLSGQYFEKLYERFGTDTSTVRSSVIGILCTSYCRTIECNSFKAVSEDDIDVLTDWILSDKSKKLRLVNRKNGLGRTNKRLHVNFK